MCGFFIGTASLLALLWTVRRWKHGCGGWHHGHRHGGWHRRGMLRWLFVHLETTPGQEKVILDEVERLQELAWRARDRLRTSRGDLADLLRKDTLGGGEVNELFDRHTTMFNDLRQAAQDALGRVHAALLPEQRHKLADLLERFGGHRHGGFAGGVI